MDRRAFIGVAFSVILAGCGKKKEATFSQNDISEFFAAVQDGDAEIIRRLLQAKPGLANAKGANGQTALQIAKQKNNDEMVEVLKKYGARE